MVYVMHYYLTKKLRLSEESANVAGQNLDAPKMLQYEATLPSTLISTQIKHEMYKLLHDSMIEILEVLDKMRDLKAPWAPTFCAIVMLTMCVEMVQVSIDQKIVRAMIEDEDKSQLSRDASREQGETLGKLIFICTEMFHKIHKTYKNNGCNPVLNRLDIDKVAHDQATVDLLCEVQKIVSLYGIVT
jgi:hypothetical protein